MVKNGIFLGILLCIFFYPIHPIEYIEDSIVSYDDILNEPTRSIDPNKPMIALTFDDGPFATYTPLILDILKQYNVCATFFVLGDHVENNPQILERMILEGHEIGNHTFSHYQLTSISKNLIKEEIDKTQEIIYNVIQRYPTILRPPYGDYNETVMNQVGELRIVKWNVDSQDWRTQNTEMIVKQVLKDVKDKSIILMHDQYKTTMEATSILVPKLLEEGYQFVSVSELYSFE